MSGTDISSRPLTEEEIDYLAKQVRYGVNRTQAFLAILAELRRARKSEADALYCSDSKNGAARPTDP